jgi:hypothetical protein
MKRRSGKGGGISKEVTKALRKIADKEFKKVKSRSKKEQKWWYLKKRK